VSLTVLIAAADRLAALQQQTNVTDANAFAETDALKALETITRLRPSVIAIEHPFATSARGTALINRIKADPTLSACEVRVLGPDGAVASSAAGASSAGVGVVTPPGIIDQRGTRRAPRVVVTRNVEVLIDGNPATLVNISVVGAQVTSPLSLRPNQRVRMAIADAVRPVRFNGVVAWASFEMPKEGPRYRAGINFYDAAPETISRFIEAITT
jgi:hypothetical protein